MRNMKSLGPLIGLVTVYLFFCFWAGEPFYSSFNRVTVLTQSVIVTAGAAPAETQLERGT